VPNIQPTANSLAKKEALYRTMALNHDPI
jgi:hypothetical protein